MASHHSTDPTVHIEEWQSLTVVDHRCESPGPGPFLFTKGMPIVINQNLYPSLGIVNCIKEAIGVDAVIDESAKVYSVGHNVWIVDSPPKCLLVQILNPKFTPMHMNARSARGNTANISSKFGGASPHLQHDSKSTETYFIWRQQVPYCAGFAITDYRFQGRTPSDPTPDLESPTKIAGGRRTYTAVYVALSRCQSLKGLPFLRAFPQATFFTKPDALPHLRVR